ncbi:two-component system response regulator [Vibrio sp. JC009]|uniref:HD-GYP domain-containing protein n=1 Tax=Vibrio sp. JC009 TaxID=2912314 RepID=UPI0023B169A9|nr:two-component system response regulator [Vibrio sp. JC009]WED24765.1 two-component system response regulator [Vibrio sp. JC009]
MIKPILLIVDDVVSNIDALRTILADDYKLKVATSGEIALKAAVTEPQPDLILLDIIMPEMDGYETCRRLKKDIRTRDIPVVFVTAKSEGIDEIKGFEAGAVDYVTKPPMPLVLKSRIRSHLALYNQTKEMFRQVQEQTKELRETRTIMVQQLGRAAEFKDNETGFHVIRMSRSAHAIALAYGLSEAQAELMQDAAAMHDIGKLGIPDHILKKPGKLDSEEWKIMKFHTLIGERILGDSQHSSLIQEAGIIARTHHERWDGTGYPDGLAGEDIPLTSRICAIADVFDALTSERPYKKPWPVEDALEYIQNESGKHFDPKVVEAFMQALPTILEIGAAFSETPEQLQAHTV